jgi:hypothetical protein
MERQMAIMTATITIDTFKSETLPIAQAGIPQGSPLSPILYNVNLVEQPINKTQGALGFVDDYSAWVVGGSLDENLRTLQTTIIPEAEGWARESGAVFERSKTGLIHSINQCIRSVYVLCSGRKLDTPKGWQTY